jgi:uncharacterized alkaline shock family protein YloU
MTDPHSAPLGDPVDLSFSHAGDEADAPAAHEFQISNSVVASIARLAALEVEGVHSVGADSFVDGLVEMFSKRGSDRGVRVTEDDQSRYQLEVHVIMRYGVELPKAGEKIQQNVRAKVTHMTGKPVAKVDVIFEGVRLDPPDIPEHDWHNQPQTD